MADCCTLLKRITKLKCVNSEVKSVNIDPNWGCLTWLYGTMSEHTIEITLDKNGSLYDPAGTES